jgi:adenylylsulfate kinase
MAGLPGTGKSTIARPLAARLPAAILDKDVVRTALFAPDHVEYSTRQDDFCLGVLLDAAAYLVGQAATGWVILDGRTFSRRYQVERVEAAAERLGAAVRVIECVCSDETARRRLATDAEGGGHVAGNRDATLHAAIKARFEPIGEPKLVVDTEQDPSVCVARCVDYLGRAGDSVGGS